MKKLLAPLLFAAALLAPTLAQAQCNGVFQAGTVCGVGNAESPRPPHAISIGSTVSLIIGTTTISSGTSNGILYNNAGILANTNALSGALLNTDTSAVPSLSRTPIIGINGTASGTLGFRGSTSGTATITPQATAGSPTLTLPNASGTFAISATSPLVLSATTGALTCATCVTSSGGGAITGTAPVAVSAAGVVSITGVDGAVLQGSGPAFTQNPTLGTAGASAGSLIFVNATSGSVTFAPVAGALGARTINIPAASGTFAVSATAPITLSAAGDIGLTTPLALNFGGTNANLTASNGGLIYSSAAGFAVLNGTATANQIPLSGASSSPSWSTATYPATAAAGTILNAGSANVITATPTPTLGANGGTGGNITFNGATSGSATVKVNSVAGTSTNFQLPASNGVAGQLLTTDGSGNTSWTAAAAGGTVTSLTAGTGISMSPGSPITTSGTITNSGVVVVKQQVFTATGTYTPNTGMIYAIIECVGSGGGGGGSAFTAAQIYQGGGGGSGSYSRVRTTAAAVGASQAVTVSNAGTGGTAGNNAGAAGGDVSVGTLCVGKGGGGGGGGAAANVGTAGLGGVAGTGDFTATGAPGATGFYNGTNTAILGGGGAGGSSIWGGGARSTTVEATGNTATNYGGGGSGAMSVGIANKAGGDGSKGAVIITEFTTQ